jgi:hypothetical protein
VPRRSARVAVRDLVERCDAAIVRLLGSSPRALSTDSRQRAAGRCGIHCARGRWRAYRDMPPSPKHARTFSACSTCRERKTRPTPPRTSAPAPSKDAALVPAIRNKISFSRGYSTHHQKRSGDDGDEHDGDEHNGDEHNGKATTITPFSFNEVNAGEPNRPSGHADGHVRRAKDSLACRVPAHRRRRSNTFAARHDRSPIRRGPPV